MTIYCNLSLLRYLWCTGSHKKHHMKWCVDTMDEFQIWKTVGCSSFSVNLLKLCFLSFLRHFILSSKIALYSKFMMWDGNMLLKSKDEKVHHIVLVPGRDSLLINGQHPCQRPWALPLLCGGSSISYINKVKDEVHFYLSFIYMFFYDDQISQLSYLNYYIWKNAESLHPTGPKLF